MALGTANDTDWLEFAKSLGFKDVNKNLLELLKRFFSAEKFNTLIASFIASFSGKTFDEVKNLYKYFRIGSSSGAQELQKQILDNYAKVLKGELTDADIAALDGGVGDAVRKFNEDTSNQISTYIQALLDNASMSFSEMVSSLSSVYKYQLEEANPSFSSPKLLANNTRMSSS